jgi:hypothetical protein
MGNNSQEKPRMSNFRKALGPTLRSSQKNHNRYVFSSHMIHI